MPEKRENGAFVETELELRSKDSVHHEDEVVRGAVRFIRGCSGSYVRECNEFVKDPLAGKRLGDGLKVVYPQAFHEVVRKGVSGKLSCATSLQEFLCRFLMVHGTKSPILSAGF